MNQNHKKSIDRPGLWGILVTTLLLVMIPLQAAAQCGDDPGSSSCIDCHETQQAHPVYGTAAWHDIHALKDCCWKCHGGNTETADKDLAHVGILENPLDDVYTDCYSCHPVDYLERADRFGAILGITPGSRATPTPVVVAMVSHNPLVIPAAPQPAQRNDPALAGPAVRCFHAGILHHRAGFADKNQQNSRS